MTISCEKKTKKMVKKRENTKFSDLFKRLNFIVFLILLFFNFKINLFSQILINEYYNTENNLDEWVELVVTEDNVDISGFTLCDAIIADNAPSGFNGGIKFKDAPLWKNLPKGTIITIYLNDVINNLLSLNLVEGRLVLEASDIWYFDKYCETCDIANWDNEALNIDNSAELFTIKNGNTIIHSIGHSSNGIGFFNNSWGTLLSSILSGNLCLSVIPGDGVNKYFGGYDQNGDFLFVNNFATLGSANRKTTGTPINFSFIDGLRKPEWTESNNLTITEINNEFNVTWEKVTGTTEPDDYYTILFLLTSGNVTQNDLPKNGTNYKVGDIIGNSKVINVFNTNSTYSFKINTSLNCGADYTVSAVVGRFRDLLQNNNQYSSNGICYNTSKFLSGKIKKEAVENFSIKTPNNERVFCVQQDTSISISTDFTNPEKYKYTWYKDGLIFLASGDYGENKSINVNSTGNYFVQASNEEGCFKNSNLINLQINLRPKISVKFNGKLITSDTIITGCIYDFIKLTGENDNGIIEWFEFENGIYKKISSKIDFVLTKYGKFIAIASNGECSDTSFIIEVKKEIIPFEIDKTLILVDKYSGVQWKQSLRITNTSNRNLTIDRTDFNIEFPFTIEKLYLFPQTFKPGESYDITILLNSDNIENKDYFLRIQSPCVNEKVITLRVTEKGLGLEYEPKEIDFGTINTCDTIKLDTTIKISYSNNDNEIDYFSINPVIKPPFKIDNPLPLNLYKFTSDSIKISLNAKLSTDIVDTLVVYYTRKGYTYSFRIPIKVRIKNQAISVYPEKFDVGKIEECKDFIDTTLKITNTGLVDMTIDNQFNESVQFAIIPFTIPAKDSIIVPIRISTQTIGAFNFKPYFTYTDCDLQKEISITGFKTHIDYIFDDGKLDFDTIFKCNSELSKIISNKLKINSNNTLYTHIDSISTSKYFKIDLEKGTELFSSNNFKVTFTPDTLGFYNEKIYFIFHPCGKRDSIELSGYYSDISFDVPDTIYFPVTKENVLSTASVTLTNNSLSDYNMHITPLSNSKFSINNSNDILIKSSEKEHIFDLSYVSNEVSHDTTILTISTNYPCLITKDIVLIAEAKPKDMIDINLILPNSFSHNANDILELEMQISAENYDLDTIEIKNFKIEIELNTFVLDLISVSGYDPNKLRVDFDVENNKMYIELLELNECVIDYRMRPLVGNDAFTKFNIVNVSYLSNAVINIIKDSLNIKLTGICDFEEMKFQFGSSDILKINQNSSSSVEIAYEIVNKENFSLVIYDLLGNKVYEKFEDELNLGNFKFNINSLNTGAYFIYYRNGLVNKKDKFFIFK